MNKHDDEINCDLNGIIFNIRSNKGTVIPQQVDPISSLFSFVFFLLYLVVKTKVFL